MRKRYLFISLLLLLITAPLGIPRTAVITYTVTNTNDDGEHSLRWAITQANSSAGLDKIHFNIPGVGPHTITVGSSTSQLLPSIDDTVIIDGFTQGGDGYSGPPSIELDGSSGPEGDGLVIVSGGDSSTIRGLMINRFKGTGIRLEGTSDNLIEGNYIGTNASGDPGLGNTGNGVWVKNSSGNTIGGTTTATRNVISGNSGDGVSIWESLSTGNAVIGNFIGITPDGLSALGNGGGSGENLGVRVGAEASNNTIGGASSSEANVISGNLKGGVSIDNGAYNNSVVGNLIGTNPSGDEAIANADKGLIIQSGGYDNTVQSNLISGNSGEGLVIYNAYNNNVKGNFIGTKKSGTDKLANTRAGISITGNPLLPCSNNVIGGTSSADRNVISGNGLEGIFLGEGTEQNLVLGNYIGTNAAGNAALGNGGMGVHIWRSPSNTIGGTETGARNVISGNGDGGIVIQEPEAHHNVVQGNYIGTNATGDDALLNAHGGVYISSSPNNTIGGADPGARNVISGNGRQGIVIQNSEAHDNTVQGNYIGTDASGTQAIPDTAGVTIDGSNTNTIAGNVISGNIGTAVTLYTSDGNKILNNYIGTNNTGTAALPNTDDGVDIAGGTNATVSGNIISGNSSTGVVLRGEGTTGNVVKANKVGTDKDGTVSIGNGEVGIGIVDGAHDNMIGGTTSEARNVISGNTQDGVFISDNGTNANKVQGNFIGTDGSGATDVGNGWDGVYICNGANGNLIGGIEAGEGNVIAYNGVGVGVDACTGNAIRANSIHSNDGLGIDLGGNGVTANDLGDGDIGANNLQNYPILTSAVSGSTTIHGTLNSTPKTSFSIDFFSNTAADPSGYGEGQTFIGSTTLTTDNNGDAPIHITFPNTVGANQFITATATDPDGNTSEFSNAIEVTQAQTVLYFVGGAVSGSKYVFDVHVKANEDRKMGNASLVFSYNSLGFGENATPQLVPREFSGGNYEAMSWASVSPNELSINIVLGSPTNGTPIGKLAPGTRVCTIEMNINDPSQNANLTWDLGSTFIYADDNTTLLTVTSGASDESPLPIQLVSITATAKDRGVCLEWTTASETNNYGFEAYRKYLGARSTSGASAQKGRDTSWTKVGFVAGHRTTLQPQSYSFIDTPTKAGYYEYRLKQIDLDGKSAYIGSLEVHVGLPKTTMLYQNYPNPFNPTTLISYAIPTQSRITLRVYDVLGRVVRTLVEETQDPGIYEAQFDASGLASGIYFYRLTAGPFVHTKKMLVVR